MSIVRLTTRRVEKPWGRRTLWPGFDPVPDGAPPIGEVWFEVPGGRQPELLIKYLFTDEKLSVQVHPDDARAHARGEPRGKSEAWLVLDAEPGAAIGLGLKRPMTPEELRASVLEGRVEADMEWPKVAADDFFYLPAGVIHALGAGITVIEVQQTSDTTYRLYDYGRPRELHVEEGIEAAHRDRYVPAPPPAQVAPGRSALVAGPHFVLERWGGPRTEMLATADRPAWLIPVSGACTVAGQPMPPGTAWMIDEAAEIAVAAGGDLLVAYPGAEIAVAA